MNEKIKEWIKKYNKKVEEEFKRDERFELFFNEEKGICEIGRTDKMVIVNQMCGEMRYWRQVLEKVCRALKLKVIGTYCLRNIRAYIRLAGFKIIGTEETQEGLRLYCEDFNTGQHATCSPAWLMTNGERAYYVTFEA